MKGKLDQLEDLLIFFLVSWFCACINLVSCLLTLFNNWTTWFNQATERTEGLEPWLRCLLTGVFTDRPAAPKQKYWLLNFLLVEPSFSFTFGVPLLNNLLEVDGPATSLSINTPFCLSNELGEEMDDFENELERDRPGIVICGKPCTTPCIIPEASFF